MATQAGCAAAHGPLSISPPKARSRSTPGERPGLWHAPAHGRAPRAVIRQLYAALVVLIVAWQVPFASPSEADQPALLWPVHGSVTSRFGSRGFWGWHRGVDIKAHHGAPIHAAAGGTVAFSGRQGSYGRVIKMVHANGLSTVYAHNSVNFVKTGDRVRAGALIGAVGRTGHAASNHLHFEVHRQGVAHDPLPLLRLPHRGSSVVMHRGASKDASARMDRGGRETGAIGKGRSRHNTEGP